MFSTVCNAVRSTCEVAVDKPEVLSSAVFRGANPGFRVSASLVLSWFKLQSTEVPDETTWGVLLSVLACGGRGIEAAACLRDVRRQAGVA